MDLRFLSQRNGIVGGIAPHLAASRVVTITPNPQGPQHPLILTVANREDGTPELATSGNQEIASEEPAVKNLLKQLRDILSGLPMESPPGSEDIYGLDTSIAYADGTLEWCNGGPEGCGGYKSNVTPTEEQRLQFKQAVDIVHELVALGRKATAEDA